VKFQKGHKKLGGKQKATKHKKTIIREALNEIIDLKPLALKNLNDFLTDNKNKNTKLKATEIVSKYIFPTNTKLSGDKDNPIELNINVHKFL